MAGMSRASVSPVPQGRMLRERNRIFYDGLWARARLVAPQRLNTWPLVQSLVSRLPRRLEVAPGLRPRLPLQGTTFVDLSPPALKALAASGARAVQAEISRVPFPDGAFDLVCALDVIEHIEDDERALAELCRVATADGTLLLSVPLHAARWSAFDELVGHHRRYEPPALMELLLRHGVSVQHSCVYGMKPRSSRLLDFGMWWLTHHPRRAMWWYNRVIMPLGVLLQPTLDLASGVIDTRDVDEILLVCKTRAAIVE